MSNIQHRSNEKGKLLKLTSSFDIQHSVFDIQCTPVMFVLFTGIKKRTWQFAAAKDVKIPPSWEGNLYHLGQEQNWNLVSYKINFYNFW